MEMDNGFSLLLPRARASFSHTLTVTGSVRFSYHSHWCLRSLIMHRSALLSTASRLHIFLILPSSPHGFTVVQCVSLPLPGRTSSTRRGWTGLEPKWMGSFFQLFFFPSIVRSSPSEFTTSRVVCYWCYSAAAVFVVVVVFLHYSIRVRVCLCVCVVSVSVFVCECCTSWKVDGNFACFNLFFFINFKICNKFSII